MRRIGLCVAVCSGVIFATVSPRAQDTPTFRTGTTLIEFTLVALDGEGRPITDLRKEELTLTEGGRSRDIAFFRFDGDTPAVSATASLAIPEGFVTNRVNFERNAVAIVLDLANMAAQGLTGQAAMRELILAYLDSVPPNTHVGLFRFAERQPMVALHPFTTDVASLRNAVRTFDSALRSEFETAAAGPTGGAAKADGGAALEAFRESEERGRVGMNRVLHEVRVNRSLESLTALGSHLAGVPGRKSIVWMTDAPPILFDNVNYEPRMRQTAQRLANLGIAIYPVDAVGLRPVTSPPKWAVSTMSVFADITGGRVVMNTNELTAGVSIAASDQRGTYTVGFYANDDPSDTWKRLQVRIKRPGASLRYREGYLLPRRANTQNWQAKEWNALSFQTLDSTAIRLTAKSDAVPNGVIVTLHVTAADVYFREKDGQQAADLEIGLVERKGMNATNVRVQPMEVSVAAAQARQRAEVIPIKTTWALNAETSGLQIIVRDRFTGRYGSLTVPLSR